VEEGRHQRRQQGVMEGVEEDDALAARNEQQRVDKLPVLGQVENVAPAMQRARQRRWRQARFGGHRRAEERMQAAVFAEVGGEVVCAGSAGHGREGGEQNVVQRRHRVEGARRCEGRLGATQAVGSAYGEVDR